MDNFDNDTIPSNPGIASFADEPAVAKKPREEQKQNHEQVLEEWRRLYNLLFQTNLFPPFADTTQERQKQTEKTLRQIVADYPNFAPVKNKVVFSRDNGSIAVETKRIEFIANPKAKKKAGDSFTLDAALTMARLASQNELMLTKGIKLTGSEEQQKLLRTAIDMVNAELPQGMKLVVRDGQQVPIANNLQQPPVQEPSSQNNVQGRLDDGSSAKNEAPVSSKTSSTENGDANNASEKSTVDPLASFGQDMELQDAAATNVVKPKTAEAEVKAKHKRRRSGGKQKTDAETVADTVGSDTPAETETQIVEEIAPEAVAKRKGIPAFVDGVVSVLTKAKASLSFKKPVGAVASENTETAETKAFTTRRSFLTAGLGGAKVSPENESAVSGSNSNNTVVEQQRAEKTTAVVKEQGNKTRRWLVFGFTAAAASSIAEPALGAGFWESLGFKRSETYERSRAGSGLYNADGSEKETAGKKKQNRKQAGEKPQSETKAEAKARKRQEAIDAKETKKQKPETRREKAERLKKEKEEAAKQKPETRREKAKREKAEKKEAEKQKKLEQKEGKGEKLAHGKVRIVCTHTGESAVLDFNNPRSCKKAFDRVTKDWREGVTHDMAPALMGLLGHVTKDLRGRGHKVPVVHIVAGFRTEKTNNMLIENSKKRNKGKSGVAKNSFHKKGMALDFYIAGVSMTKVCNAAKRAGAFSYSAGNFVHMDTRGAYTV